MSWLQSVKLTSTSVVREHGSQYVLYKIEIQQFQEDGNILGIWTVSRRYNEFYELHRILKNRYTALDNLEFPRKRIILKLQKSFVEARRRALEGYLRVSRALRHS